MSKSFGEKRSSAEDNDSEYSSAKDHYETAEHPEVTSWTECFEETERMLKSESPPEQYWKSLAEKRRSALIKTMKENKKLYLQKKRILSKLQSVQKAADYFSLMYFVLKSVSDKSEEARRKERTFKFASIRHLTV
ncbi:hypothetical protein TrispH2_004505 [Trichoplax sp. H2]|nr:hypothetical protein TrispH2_004505 [Trichoplax sp. H2]|eukprot:RDD43317.1 hypothetical protein TrispH2_004505 [Trichoplax sp. H2]